MGCGSAFLHQRREHGLVRHGAAGESDIHVIGRKDALQDRMRPGLDHVDVARALVVPGTGMAWWVAVVNVRIRTLQPRRRSAGIAWRQHGRARAPLVLRATESEKTPIAASLAAGLSIGVAIAFKQVAVLNVPFFLLAFGLRVRGPDRWRRLAAFTGWMGVGVALVWGPILAWLQLRGALSAAVGATFLHNLSYAGALPLFRRLELLVSYGTPLLPSQGVAWALAVLGLS